MSFNRAVFTKSEDEQNLTESGTLEDAMQGAFDVISGAEMMAVKVDGDCNGQDPNITFICGHSRKVRFTNKYIVKWIIVLAFSLKIVIESDNSTKNTTIVFTSRRPESECIPVEEVKSYH